LGKKVAKMGEDGKVAVRNVRKDILKKLDRWGP
jgi:ribosome recycling factor